MKDVDGVADLRKDGKIERGGDDLLSHSGGGEQLNAWVEIDQKVNGKKKTYVYDPNFQKEYKLNGYKLTYGAKRTLKYVNYKRVN